MANVAIPHVLSLFPNFLAFLTTLFVHPANFYPAYFVIPVTIRQAEWEQLVHRAFLRAGTSCACSILPAPAIPFRSAFAVVCLGANGFAWPLHSASNAALQKKGNS